MKKILKVLGIISLVILFPIGLLLLYRKIYWTEPAGPGIDGQAAAKIDEIKKQNEKAKETIKDEINNMPIADVVDWLKRRLGRNK